MSEFQLGQRGLRMDAPQAGDIVTVKLKPCPRQTFNIAGALLGSAALASTVEDESKNPHHYRHTAIWRVIAANGGQAVVEQLSGYSNGRREVWAIDAHDWFDATDLWAAMEEADRDEADKDDPNSRRADTS